MFHLLEDEKEAEKILNGGGFLVLPTESIYFLVGQDFEGLKDVGGFDLKKNLNLVTEKWFRKNVKNLSGKGLVFDLFFPGAILLKLGEELFYVTDDQRTKEVLDLVGGHLQAVVLNYVSRVPLTSDFEEVGEIFDLACHRGGSCDFGFLPAMIELDEDGVSFYGADLFGFKSFFKENQDNLQNLKVFKDFKSGLNKISSFTLRDSEIKIQSMKKIKEHAGRLFALKESKSLIFEHNSDLVEIGSISNMQTVSRNFYRKLISEGVLKDKKSIQVLLPRLPKNEYSELFLNEIRWLEG